MADKGYHKASLLRELTEQGYRPYIPKRPFTGRRRWTDKRDKATAAAFYQNRARVGRAKGKRWQRKRGEVLERTFPHGCETGAARRTRLRGRENVRKRHLLTAAAANLGLILRTVWGQGAPRGWAQPRSRAGSTADSAALPQICLRRHLKAARRWVHALGSSLPPAVPIPLPVAA